MNRIEQLIEDYLRKIDSLSVMIKEKEYILAVTTKDMGWEAVAELRRLKTKRGCYKSFVAELQRIVN